MTARPAAPIPTAMRPAPAGPLPFVFDGRIAATMMVTLAPRRPPRRPVLVGALGGVVVALRGRALYARNGGVPDRGAQRRARLYRRAAVAAGRRREPGPGVPTGPRSTGRRGAGARQRCARPDGRRRRGWVAAALAALALIGAVALARVRASATIDGIGCATGGPVALHTHQRLAIYDRGRPVPVPRGIGAGATPCLYALHTHRDDGLISVESPLRRAYTLGQFFDIWRQPVGRDRVAAARADVSHPLRAYVDGRPYRGDPRAIPLRERTLITVEIGPPWASPPPYTFPAGT